MSYSKIFSKNNSIFFLALLASTFSAQAGTIVGTEKEGSDLRVVYVKNTSAKFDTRYSEDSVVLSKRRAVIAEESKASDTEFTETWYRDGAMPSRISVSASRLTIMNAAELLQPADDINWSQSEVKTLVRQGPDENRIKLTILGDGYTLAEKDRFFEDAQRIADDLFTGDTFASYLPLFNVYAVFVPSQESGITDLRNKNTAFGLYRSPKGSKRGIMPGNSSAIERALSMAPARADYPIIIANDNFYGGLGGRYAITTRSVESGTMVLRHELGHNFGNVGEEYDGGQVYSGANHSGRESLPWNHWIDGSKEIHEGNFITGAYVWKSLNGGKETVRFNIPEQQISGQRLFVRISSVGWSNPNEIKVKLDGVDAEITGLYTADRSFFDLKPNATIAPGAHTLEIQDVSGDGDNVLAFAQVFSMPLDYDFTADKVGGFLTYNSSGRSVGYRPTEDSCLMRNMRLKKFCSVDQENMWHQFFNRVELIDGVQQKGNQVELAAPNLNSLEIKWFKSTGQGWSALTQYDNLRSISRPELDAGKYRVDVKFRSPEIRKWDSKFEDSKEFSI